MLSYHAMCILVVATLTLWLAKLVELAMHAWRLKGVAYETSEQLAAIILDIL